MGEQVRERNLLTLSPTNEVIAWRKRKKTHSCVILWVEWNPEGRDIDRLWEDIDI